MTKIGIPSYAAPEILLGEMQYTEKVDVYSFAMRTFDTPFDGRGLLIG